MQTEREKFLGQIATLYAEREGVTLRAELEQIGGSSTPTPGLDKKLRGRLFRMKYKVYARAGGLIAACLALALLLPLVLWQPHAGVPAPASPTAAAPDMAAAFALPEMLEEEDTADEYGAQMALERRAGGLLCDDPVVGGGEALWGDYETPYMAGEANIAFDQAVEAAFLSFALPEGFDLVDAYAHIGQGSIYYIHYAGDQLIVLTVQYGRHFETYLEVDDVADHWDTMELGEHTVHYYRGESYTIVNFEKDGALYDLMSMEVELETLILLSQAILGG